MEQHLPRAAAVLVSLRLGIALFVSLTVEEMLYLNFIIATMKNCLGKDAALSWVGSVLKELQTFQNCKVGQQFMAISNGGSLMGAFCLVEELERGRVYYQRGFPI